MKHITELGDNVLSSSNMPGNTSNTAGFKLHPSTMIKFELKTRSFVKIEVYDILGQFVTTLANEFRDAGTHEIIFDGMNLPSGVYFYKVEAGNFTDIKKMGLLK